MTGAYDVIIIGTGAGGGTLARQLAPSGKRVLLLERGDYLPREPRNWDTAEVFVNNRYISADTWTDVNGKPFQPQTHYYVGGATKLYGAALYRLRAEDFSEIRHHDGVSPAWPIPYEVMEPFYTRAEQLYQVHGARGEDPTEPMASAPYPYPPVSHEPRIQQLSDDLAAAGFNPFHSPCGVLLNEADMPHGACVRCPTCDGFPCLVHAKSDAEVLAVRPALEFPNVTLLTQAMAVRLETNDAGTAVTRVVVEHDGQLEQYSGDIVVVSCGAANSAKLLLRSATDRHPGGLANGSDEVGRNYMFHDTQAVLALSKEPNPTVFQKTLGLNDFYFRGPDFDYPMGNIQMIGKSQTPMFRGEKPLEAELASTWALDDVAKHAVDFWLSTEDLPQSENRITLDQNGTIRLRYRASNPTAGRELYRQLRSMLGVMGMHEDHLIHRFAYMKSANPIAGVAHQAGTCRFGTDPATSVLDVNCKAHELDNLYVVDTSFFPSIGAVNPALTAMANAIRVGDHLLDRLSAPAVIVDTVPPVPAAVRATLAD
jgi:choline dehydrogenase-like flavoprotein